MNKSKFWIGILGSTNLPVSLFFCRDPAPDPNQIEYEIRSESAHYKFSTLYFSDYFFIYLTRMFRAAMAGMQRSPRLPQFPERLKGGRLERWKDYWLGVATDYRDALVEMGQSARKKPVKASIVVSLLGRLIVKIFIGTVNTKLTTSCPYWLLLDLYRIEFVWNEKNFPVPVPISQMIVSLVW